jgi:RHS repeat-associated protein
MGNLRTVVKPGSTSNTTYTYLVDGMGRRVGKREKIGTGTDVLKKRWLYRDSLAPVAELDANGAIVARFVYGSRRNVPDLVIKGNIVYRLFTDQLGSPRLAVNIADPSDVPYRRDYSAFGEVIGALGAADWIPFGFAGGLYDPDTGLVRFGARDYDPQIGRWVSKDPIRFNGRQANMYAYVGLDAINRRDPEGKADPEYCENMAANEYDWCASNCEKAEGEKGICEQAWNVITFSNPQLDCMRACRAENQAFYDRCVFPYPDYLRRMKEYDEYWKNNSSGDGGCPWWEESCLASL